MPTVLITGASGYAAQSIVKLLFEKGYNVVGTVRSAEKGEKLVKRFANKGFSYEIVEDLGAPNAFDDVLKKHSEVTVFIHTASPVDTSAKDLDKEIIQPAVDGVLNVLHSVKKYGPQITHVVLTSSMLAHVSINPEDQGKPVTEETWNNIPQELAVLNMFFGYMASKSYGERAAWKFIETEKPHFTFNTIAPAYIFGPPAYGFEKGDAIGFSLDIIGQAVRSKPGDDAPQYEGVFVDVRDVAKAHLHAFESDVKNTRYLLITGQFVGQDILDVINEIPQLKGKVATGNPEAAEEARKKLAPYDNSKTRKLIESSISFKQLITETAEQLLVTKE